MIQVLNKYEFIILRMLQKIIEHMYLYIVFIAGFTIIIQNDHSQPQYTS